MRVVVFALQFACESRPRLGSLRTARTHLVDPIGDLSAGIVDRLAKRALCPPHSTQGASEVPRNGIDVAYRFRQDSNMYWATGVEEPDFHAVLDGRTQKYILVAPEYNQRCVSSHSPPPTIQPHLREYPAHTG